MDRNRGNMIFCSAAVLAVLLFFGWLSSGTGTGPASPAVRPAATKLVQGPYTIQVKLNTAEALFLKPNTFTVTISDTDERPVSGADIAITLFMPDMFCGTSTVKAVEMQPGVYQGEAIPLMAGSSAAEVKVQLEGRSYSLQHPFLAVR